MNNTKRGLPKFVSRIDPNFVQTPATKAYIAERKASALKYSCDNLKADVRRYEREQKRSRK